MTLSEKDLYLAKIVGLKFGVDLTIVSNTKNANFSIYKLQLKPDTIKGRNLPCVT